MTTPSKTNPNTNILMIVNILILNWANSKTYAALLKILKYKTRKETSVKFYEVMAIPALAFGSEI